MIARVLLCGLLCSPLLAGCGSMQRPPKGTLVALRPPSKSHAKTRAPNKTPKATEVIKTTGTKEKVTDVSEPDQEENRWLTKMRQQLAQVAKEIKADLDCHESEGLDAFAPDARQQVGAMRSEMNGPSDITR